MVFDVAEKETESLDSLSSQEDFVAVSLPAITQYGKQYCVEQSFGRANHALGQYVSDLIHPENPNKEDVFSVNHWIQSYTAFDDARHPYCEKLLLRKNNRPVACITLSPPLFTYSPEEKKYLQLRQNSSDITKTVLGEFPSDVVQSLPQFAYFFEGRAEPYR